MTEIEEIIAIERIKTVKARYFRGIDLKDAALLHSILHDDVVLDYCGAATDPATGVNLIPGATGEVLRGREACVPVMIGSVADTVTVHQGGPGDIVITGETTAEGIWPMFDILKFPPGAPVAELHGWGHYFETYEKVSGEWKLKTLRLTRQRLECR